MELPERGTTGVCADLRCQRGGLSHVEDSRSGHYLNFRLFHKIFPIRFVLRKYRDRPKGLVLGRGSEVAQKTLKTVKIRKQEKFCY